MENQKATAKIRYHLLDTLRGITLISMMLYHTVWDIVYIFGINWGWYRSVGAYVWQQSICFTFILLSGFCWSIGRHHLKRGLTVFAAGALVSAVTCLFLYEDRVIFGVLTLLGTAMLFTIPLDKLFCKIKPQYGLLVAGLLFFLTRNVNVGSLGFEGTQLVTLPTGWYDRGYGMAFLGFPSESFYSTDYFSLIPWIFLFFMGYFLYQLLCKREGMGSGVIRNALVGGKCRPLEFIGRHSLLIYMLHQPVVFGILMLLLG